jgi:N-ethylmaleimide reductase
MRDLDAHVNLFAPDIRVSRERTGRAHLKAWVDDTLRNQFTGTSHHLGQHIVEFRDPDHAIGVLYSKNEHECGAEWVIMQMLYWDDYERIEGRWYFRRRLPCYWYATDLNKPPVGDMKMRWPGREPYGAFHELFLSWREFWAARSERTSCRRWRHRRRSSAFSRRCVAARRHRPSGYAEMTTLFEPLQLGEIALANRVIMAPMTRSRCDADAMPNDLMVAYYRQRASAGLIVAEGIAPSRDGIGYCRTPGLYAREQVTAWRQVTDAVHAEGGRIVAQFMHCGRVCSHFNKPEEAEMVALSKCVRPADLYRCRWHAGTDRRGRWHREIPAVVDEYVPHATLAAGFDGVELHCTSGYLPMQFMAINSNLRTDAYGGSVGNRVRFVVEALEAMTGAGGSGRVGLRICPGNPFNDVLDPEPAVTYEALLSAVCHLRPAYLHVVRSPLEDFDAFALARRHFDGPLILNDSFDRASASQALAEGRGAAVSFARHFIGNPDRVPTARRLPSPASIRRRCTHPERRANGYPCARA